MCITQPLASTEDDEMCTQFDPYHLPPGATPEVGVCKHNAHCEGYCSKGMCVLDLNCTDKLGIYSV